MLETIQKLFDVANGVLWGVPMFILLIGTGLYLFFGLRMLTLRKLPEGFRRLWDNRQIKHGTEGEISSFNALMTVLAATVGTGNIAGVATAIFVGGPGALFWMWCVALVGMATKFSEILLAMKYREVTPAGNVVGGPMYYIKNGLGPKWLWMGTFFAVFGVIASFGIGNAVQGNSVADALESSFGVPRWTTAIVLFFAVGIVLLGGLGRIAKVTGRLVPFMALLYIGASLLVVFLHIDQVPRVLSLIFREAFTDTAAEGGFLGATVWLTMRYGVARGLFSNEAGMGSAPIIHAAATSTPMNQAMIGMLGVFIDTIIICSMTGFAILVTGLWTNGINGAALTTLAFESTFPGVGAALVSISLCLFAYSTFLGWSVCGERCAVYLGGDRALKPYRLLFTVVVPLGALAHLDLVWAFADFANAMMALPNLLAVLLLSPVVFTIVKEYRTREKAKG